MTAFAVRPAGADDIATLARHRAWMFRDMGKLPEDKISALQEATASYLREAQPRGEYVAWIAEDNGTPPVVIGGAGVQLRPILPRPCEGEGDLELGPEAIVLNVYVESEWRRRGVAQALTVISRTTVAREHHRWILLVLFWRACEHIAMPPLTLFALGVTDISPLQ